ncbi:hypothetical protein V6N12_047535 [Hibiscus sabdariffa]|uniref:Uncharacterized protein n=1 Tax=Hibiscus sabdariffa TaxID=183260 RepID=A0ABR2DB74_9ROSI
MDTMHLRHQENPKPYIKHKALDLEDNFERDECGLGTGGCCGGVVHRVVAGADVPIAVEGKGDRVREHVHKWDSHLGSCGHIFLHIHHLDDGSGCSHTCQLIPPTKRCLFSITTYVLVFHPCL